MSDKAYEFVKQQFLLELDYLSYIGRKIFIHPFVGRSRKSLLCYAITFLLVFVTSAQLFTTLCVTAFTTSDWCELINIAPNLGVVLMTLIRLAKIHIHRKLYYEIFVHFRDDLWSLVLDDEDYRHLVSRYTTITKYVTRFLFYYCIPLVIIVNSFPRIFMYYEVHIAKKELQYLYPFDGWYPFDKIKWYYVVYMWECCMTVLVVLIAGVSGTIHAAYTSFICMELKILGHSIENLISDEDVDKLAQEIDVGNTHRVIKRKLGLIARRHQLLARITFNLNTVLGDSMLLTYFFGSVFMGLTFFTATVEDNMYKAVRYFSMCCSLLIDCFYHCMIGQVLSDHSGNLANSIYSANWPYADNATKMMLMMLMVRAQKPFEYTAKGYLKMNLETFSRICSLSFQLFNLVRQVYE